MDVVACGLTELDVREMRETEGGGRLRVPGGDPLAAEPVYEGE